MGINHEQRAFAMLTALLVGQAWVRQANTDLTMLCLRVISRLPGTTPLGTRSVSQGIRFGQ